ncbi:hypothetical protein C1752_03634 [Acaryochloris thomasi RCC1774]|uniref:Uncharacterized protein n=1 Tax=Acaryochloris thomasi RCC1774 TaxID=1764569 RepID=A0A2W1JUK3_9CYAN|nr:hypothetical protein [Acaryochloris thomasi]PZD72491.1 hypothetical protein C1752_03634 [Acaryochloris thomasi RCC1774]
MTTETITYQQLCDRGLSDYQVRYLTQSLIPASLEQGVHFYRLRDVIVEVRHYLNSNRLPPLHREAVNDVLVSLLNQLDNVVTAPFGLSRDQQIGFHIQKVLQTQPRPTDPASVVMLSNSYPEVVPTAATDLSSGQNCS